MKKKLGIVVIIMLLLTGVTVAGVQIHKQRRQEFEQRVQEMYGTENYLGPMSKKVKPLTEKDIKELNPDGELVFDDFISDPIEISVHGRFNKEKVEDIYDAREVAYSVAAYFGRKYDTDTFLYGWCNNISCTEYWFKQYYKGVSVGGRIIVTVDEDGNVYHVDISSIPREDIIIKSVKPKFTKEDIIAYMDEKYKEYEIRICELYLLAYSKEVEEKTVIKNSLRWEVEFSSENTDDYRIYFDAQTGEVLDVVVGEDVY